MTKLNGKWFVLIGSVFSFLFYMAVTSEAYFSMRHLSLAEPDPFYFIIMGFVLVFTGWFMFVSMAQNISTEIATEVGGFCVHSLDPVETIDPLDYYDMDEEAKEEIRDMIRDSWKYKDYLSEEYILEICGVMHWNHHGVEISVFLREYQASVDGMKPIGLYPDGGIKLIGMHGFRWWIGGTSLLACNPEHIIPHGDGGVCISAVKNYTDIEQLQGLPPWLQRGIVHSFAQFQPGKHVVTFGNRPHQKAVRARVKKNDDAADDELKVRPKYIYTLGLQEQPINITARTKMLKDYGGTLQKEVDGNRRSLDTWGKRKPVKEQPPVLEKGEEETDAKER